MSVCPGGRELGPVDRRQEPEDRQALPDRRRREDQLRKGPQGCQLGPGAGRRPPSRATIVIFKSFITFFVELKLYKNVNLSNNTIENIKAYQKHSVYISNSFLFFVAIYILTKIFYN